MTNQSQPVPPQLVPPMRAAIIPVTPLQQNCSLIWCTRTMKGALVDPGGDLDKLKLGVERAGVTLEKLLVTHGHLDHCGQAGMLAEVLQEMANIEVVISSSWAAYHSLTEIRDLLEGWPALHSRIVGITEQRIRGRIERSDFPERETQCLDWLISNKRSLY